MLKLLLGDPNARKLKRYQPIVSDINLLEEEIAPLSDDELRGKTAAFQERLANAGSLDNQRPILDEILPEAFAVVREAASRTTAKASGRISSRIGRWLSRLPALASLSWKATVLLRSSSSERGAISSSNKLMSETIGWKRLSVSSRSFPTSTCWKRRSRLFLTTNFVAKRLPSRRGLPTLGAWTTSARSVTKSCPKPLRWCVRPPHAPPQRLRAGFRQGSGAGCPGFQRWQAAPGRQPFCHGVRRRKEARFPLPTG